MDYGVNIFSWLCWGLHPLFGTKVLMMMTMILGLTGLSHLMGQLASWDHVKSSELAFK